MNHEAKQSLLNFFGRVLDFSNKTLQELILHKFEDEETSQLSNDFLYEQISVERDALRKLHIGADWCLTNEQILEFYRFVKNACYLSQLQYLCMPLPKLTNEEDLNLEYLTSVSEILGMARQLQNFPISF